MAKRKNWTVLELLRWTTDYFTDKDVESPRASAEILLARVLDTDRIGLYVRYDQPLLEDELAQYKALIKRRAAGEPVGYIMGRKEFRSMDFLVNSHVLIPRPETEGLVEAVLAVVPSQDDSVEPMRILELGVGSGAVIISAASERPGHRFFASDRSFDAIMTAAENARRLLPDTPIRFFAGNWLSPLKAEDHESGFHVIMSNPPYIRNDELPRLAPEIRLYEPKTALIAGNDGLGDIRVIISHAHQHLIPGGWLFLEMGWDQRHAVEDMTAAFAVYEAPVFHKDYAGHDRIVGIRRKEAG